RMKPEQHCVIDLRRLAYIQTADAGVRDGEGLQRDGAYAIDHVNVDQHLRRFAGRWRAEGVADVQGGVRPGRLGQVLDGGGEAAAALDQQHVTLAQGLVQQPRG